MHQYENSWLNSDFLSYVRSFIHPFIQLFYLEKIRGYHAHIVSLDFQLEIPTHIHTYGEFSIAPISMFLGSERKIENPEKPCTQGERVQAEAQAQNETIHALN